MDITLTLVDKWTAHIDLERNDEFADHVVSLLKQLSFKYGYQFDEVLELVDGFTGSAITKFWQSEKEEGNLNEFQFIL